MSYFYHRQAELDNYFDEIQSSNIVEPAEVYPFRLEFTRSIESVLYDSQAEFTPGSIINRKSLLTMKDILFGGKYQGFNRYCVKGTKSTTELLKESQCDDSDEESNCGVTDASTGSSFKDFSTCRSSPPTLVEPVHNISAEASIQNTNCSIPDPGTSFYSRFCIIM